MNKLSVVLFSAALCATTVSAQNSDPTSGQGGPSLQETTQWILQNLSEYAGGEYHVNQYRLLNQATFTDEHFRFSIDNCTLSYTFHRTIEPRAGRIYNTVYGTVKSTQSRSIPLGALVEISRATQDGVTGVHMRTLTQAIHKEWSDVTTDVTGRDDDTADNTDDGQSNVNSIDIGFTQSGKDNTGMAARMMNALTHARDLCKGSYRPNNGEPF
jgi:hypothetical protein